METPMNIATKQLFPTIPTAFSGHSLGQSLSRSLRKFVGTLDIWMKRHHQRRQLRALAGSHLLKDMGINDCDAWNQGRKPFWKE